MELVRAIGSFVQTLGIILFVVIAVVILVCVVMVIFDMLFAPVEKQPQRRCTRCGKLYDYYSASSDCVWCYDCAKPRDGSAWGGT